MTKKRIPKKVYDRVESMAYAVKEDFRKKGLAIPFQNSDGSIIVEDYVICKDQDGFYQILKNNQLIVEKINLPQTAALVANDLALNKNLNQEILNKDREYGFKLFDEQSAKITANKFVKNKDYDRAELLMNKSIQAQIKSRSLKKELMMRFAKLRIIR